MSSAQPKPIAYAISVTIALALFSSAFAHEKASEIITADVGGRSMVERTEKAELGDRFENSVKATRSQTVGHPDEHVESIAEVHKAHFYKSCENFSQFIASQSF